MGSFRRVGPGGVGAGELVLSLAWAGRENWQADQGSYHPDPHPGLWTGPPTICVLLALLKGSVFKNQNCRISITQNNSRLSERSPSEDSDIDSVAEAKGLKQTGDSLQWMLQVKLFGQRDIWCDTPCHTTASTFLSSIGRRFQGWSADMEGLGNEWGRSVWCEIHKESILKLWGGTPEIAHCYLYFPLKLNVCMLLKFLFSEMGFEFSV